MKDKLSDHPNLISIRTISKILIFLMLCKFTHWMTIMESDNWWWFMTNWGHLAVNIYYFLASICGIFKVSKTGALFKFKDTMLHTACALQFMIFFFYWLVLSYMDFVRIMGYEDK